MDGDVHPLALRRLNELQLVEAVQVLRADEHLVHERRWQVEAADVRRGRAEDRLAVAELDRGAFSVVARRE